MEATSIVGQDPEPQQYVPEAPMLEDWCKLTIFLVGGTQTTIWGTRDSLAKQLIVGADGNITIEGKVATPMIVWSKIVVRPYNVIAYHFQHDPKISYVIMPERLEDLL